jgi:hypothetical protein
MMLAEREDLDIFHNDQLVVVLVEDSAIDNVAEVLLVALGEEQHSLGIALRCVQQTLTVGVLTKAFQHRPHGTRELLEVLCLLLLSGLLPAPCAFAGPAEPIEVDCGVLCVGAVGATGGQGCLRFIVFFYVYFTIPDHVSAVDAATVRVRARAVGASGEVAGRSVEVDHLTASFRYGDGMVQTFTLLLIARLHRIYWIH